MTKEIEILNSIVAIDVETSGPNVFENDLLYLAFIPFNRSIPSLEVAIAWHTELYWSGRGKEFFERYEETYKKIAVNPEIFCKIVTNYLDRNFNTKVTLVGHNVGFDYYFLKKTFFKEKVAMPANLSHRTIDTHTLLLEKIIKGTVAPESVSSDHAFDFFKLTTKKRHTALEDARMALELFEKLIALP